MISMTSMELDDEDKLDADMPIAMPDKPDYPYGLRICLTSDEIEKLGIDPEDAAVGGKYIMQAICRVTSISCDDRGGNKCWRIESQIEDMGIMGQGEEGDLPDTGKAKEAPKAGVGDLIGVY